METCHDCYINPATVFYVLGAARCPTCSTVFDSNNRAIAAERLADWTLQFEARDCSDGDCGYSECQDCCEHDALECAHCIDCGKVIENWADRYYRESD